MSEASSARSTEMSGLWRHPGECRIGCLALALLLIVAVAWETVIRLFHISSFICRRPAPSWAR